MRPVSRWSQEPLSACSPASEQRSTLAPMVWVSTLGPLRVRSDGGEVPIPGRNERVVLAALAAFPADGVPTDGLTEALWNDTPPRSGTKVLQNVVLRLRKALGAESITTLPGGYAVSASVDSSEFERLVRDGRAMAAEHHWHGASAALQAAVAMLRGPPLPELADWPVGHHVATRLDELGRLVREEQVAADLACGRSHEVVPELEAMVSEDPLRERRWTLLMLALYRCGRQADALRAFERARLAFGDVGLELGRDVVELDRAIGIRALALQVDGPANAPRQPAPADRTTGHRPPADHNLPVAASRYIVHDDRLHQLVATVEANRLVTLVGPAGVGKTRLALEAAWRCVDRFDDAVRLVELAPVVDAEAVLSVLASAVSAEMEPGVTMLESVLRSIARQHTLLLIDNCEHVVDSVGAIVAEIVKRCPCAHVLATSREPLGLSGERVVAVASLGERAAVELFCDRAAAADESFVLGAEDQSIVADLCGHLDGLPLAVELAASRITSMTPSELLQRVGAGLTHLHGSGRCRVGRHQTLDTAVDWSYRLLDHTQQTVFNRLSVFAGSFHAS